jgi:hypothetical protein
LSSDIVGSPCGLLAQTFYLLFNSNACQRED